jgi:hypothetical protein
MLLDRRLFAVWAEAEGTRLGGGQVIGGDKNNLSILTMARSCCVLGVRDWELVGVNVDR